MSEIIRKIVAEATGAHYAVQEPLVFSSIEVVPRAELDFLTEYFVGVKLGHSVRVPEGEREEAVRVMKRALIELIFGEFRPLLARAGYSLYNRDFDEAKRAIEEVEKRMFYE